MKTRDSNKIYKSYRSVVVQKKCKCRIPEKLKIKMHKRLFTTIGTDELKRRRDKAEKNNYMQSKLHASLRNRVNPFGDPSAASSTSQKEAPAGKFSAAAREQRRGGKTKGPRNVAAPDIKLPPTETKIGEKSSGKYIGFMCLSGVRLEHPMSDLLLSYAEEGHRA